jgi:hypothetical protein
MYLTKIPEIVPFKAEHYTALFDKYYVMRHGLDPNAVGRVFEEMGPAFSGFYQGKLLACGGVVIPWTGLGEAWCAVSRDIHLLGAMATFVRMEQIFKSIISENHLRRVHADVDAGNRQSMKFVEHLGFKPEFKMYQFGPNGETYIRYVLFTGE